MRHRGDMAYTTLSRLGGLALVIVAVLFQRRGLMNFSEVLFLATCITLQEAFVRLPSLHRFRGGMLLAYTLLPLALVGWNAGVILEQQGQFVPLVLFTPLPLVLVSIQIMVLYLREAPRLTSVVVVLALFSTVIGVRRNVGDAEWAWLAAICSCAAAFLALHYPGTLNARLAHTLAGRPSAQGPASRPGAALRPSFLLSVPVLALAAVLVSGALFFLVPRPQMRAGDSIISVPDAPGGTSPGGTGLPGSGGSTGSEPPPNSAGVSGLSDGVELGDFGQIQLNPETALIVREVGRNGRDGPVYLRAYTFGQFDGLRWLPHGEADSVVEVPEADRRQLAEARTYPGAHFVRRSYAVEPRQGAIGNRGELPVPVQPVSMRRLTGPLAVGGIDQVVRAPLLQTGTGYTVEAAEPIRDETQISRELAGVVASARGISTEYLSVPVGLREKLREVYLYFDSLAPARLGSYASAAEIVRLFREAEHPGSGRMWQYSLNDRPLPGRDAIVRFLDTRQPTGERTGHCEYFATAMVLLMRCNGIPARLCAGFVSRTRGEGGVREVTFADAHAWVEVWMHNYGWMTFDPTPPAPEPTEEPEPGPAPAAVEDTPAEPEPEPDAAATPEKPRDWFRDYNGQMQQQWLSEAGQWSRSTIDGMGETLAGLTAWMPDLLPQNPWLRAAVMLVPPLGLAIFWLSRRRRRRRQVSELMGQGNGVARRERGLYAQLLLLLSRYGHNKRPSETPREFALRVSQSAGDLHAPLAGLTRIYYDIRFGAQSALAEEFKLGLDDYSARLREHGSTQPPQ